MQDLNVLLVTKGHPFDRGPFFDLFDSLKCRWTHVEQPAAQVFFDPHLAAAYDVFVLYDMPGVQFGPRGPRYPVPDAAYRQGVLDLLDTGKGMVFLHHAIAGWPAWEEYAEIVGGRFLYTPSSLRGSDRQDSGYRHSVKHTVSRVGDHPITADLPDRFTMTDELYLYEVFEDSVEPLLTSDHAFVAGNFYSASKVVLEGKMYDNEGWDHDPGSALVGWTKHYGNSPICYLQGGDDPVAWASPEWQQALANAINWAGSDDAHAWARARNAATNRD